MVIRKIIQKEAGVAPGEILVKGLISLGGLLRTEGILQNGLPMVHLILKNLMGIQVLHLVGIRGGDVTRTIHEMNSKG